MLSTSFPTLTRMLSQESTTTLSGKGKSKAQPADELLDEEKFWVHYQPWLQERGYMLRPRYRQEWEPSWWKSKKEWTKCEDGVTSRASTLDVLDATRISDGKFVALKKTLKSRKETEVEILNFFSSGSIGADSRNHCVPILDVLDIPQEEDLIIIVMPLLRPYDSPWFDTVGEAVACFKQLFEGLAFMHEHHVAHRDCAKPAIMMDASALYRDGYHPRDIDMARDYSGRAKFETRSNKPHKYYFVGFGLARKYDSDTTLEMPSWGFDKSVPEFNVVPPAPCDPYATDVYYLGNMIKEDFLLQKSGFKFMEPLVTAMTNPNSSERPTMEQVVARFEEIRDKLNGRRLRSQVHSIYDDSYTKFKLGVPHSFRRAKSVLKRVPPSPTQ